MTEKGYLLVNHTNGTYVEIESDEMEEHTTDVLVSQGDWEDDDNIELVSLETTADADVGEIVEYYSRMKLAP